LKKTLESITKWLKDSGCSFNESTDPPQIEIELNKVIIKSKPFMNVLGVFLIVIFNGESKLTVQ
jgi:hypothetical protein